MFMVESGLYLLNESEKYGFKGGIDYLVVFLIKSDGVWHAYKNRKEISFESVDQALSNLGISVDNLTSFLNTVHAFEAIMIVYKEKSIYINMGLESESNPLFIMDVVRKHLYTPDAKISVIESGSCKVLRSRAFIEEARNKLGDAFSAHNGFVGDTIGVKADYVKSIAMKYNISEREAVKRILDELFSSSSISKPERGEKLIVVIDHSAQVEVIPLVLIEPISTTSNKSEALGNTASVEELSAAGDTANTNIQGNISTQSLFLSTILALGGILGIAMTITWIRGRR